MSVVLKRFLLGPPVVHIWTICCVTFLDLFHLCLTYNGTVPHKRARPPVWEPLLYVIENWSVDQEAAEFSTLSFSFVLDWLHVTLCQSIQSQGLLSVVQLQQQCCEEELEEFDTKYKKQSQKSQITASVRRKMFQMPR